MIAAASFFLECFAIAALLGLSTWLLCVLGFELSRRLVSFRNATLRADLALILGLLPAIVSLAGTSAVAWPSIAGALGWMEDHCQTHDHHLHVCLLHSNGLSSMVASLGALALAVGTVRTFLLLRSSVRARRDLALLERLGCPLAADPTIIELPGAPHFCHAIGLVRGRILLSKSLKERLLPDELESALAHERAHLRRRDSLALFLLAISSLFHPPVISNRFLRGFRLAAEEACDDTAALFVNSGVTVARALVAVAELQHGSPLVLAGAEAFGEQAFEARVRRLLGNTRPEPRTTHGLLISTIVGTLIGFGVFARTEHVHHALETMLQLIF